MSGRVRSFLAVVALLVAAALPAPVAGARSLSSYGGAGVSRLPVQAIAQTSCRRDYRCTSVTGWICVQHGRDAPFTNRVPGSRCTAFEYKVRFVAAWNRQHVWIDRTSIVCPFIVRHLRVTRTCAVADDGGTASGRAGVKTVIKADLGSPGGPEYESFAFVFVTLKGHVGAHMYFPPLR